MLKLFCVLFLVDSSTNASQPVLHVELPPEPKTQSSSALPAVLAALLAVLLAVATALACCVARLRKRLAAATAPLPS